jgi:zinc protease
MPVDRSRLPVPGPEPAFAFPEIRRRRLANGLDAWTAVHREVPLLSVLVLVRAGASFDPADRPGLAAITGDLLDEGCGDLDALALHEALGRLGAQVDTEVGSDATLIGLTTLERSAAPSLALVADMLIRPRLEAGDFDRVRDLLSRKRSTSGERAATSQYAVSMAASDDDVSLPCTPYPRCTMTGRSAPGVTGPPGAAAAR